MGIDGIPANEPRLPKRLVDSPDYPKFHAEIFAAERGPGL